MKKSDRYLSNEINNHEAEFLVFEPRFKFELGGSNMVGSTLYFIFQDLSRAQFKPVLGGLETGLKFIKFGHWIIFPFLFSNYEMPSSSTYSQGYYSNSSASGTTQGATSSGPTQAPVHPSGAVR